MTKKRIDWIDRWKGMLILLVVLGHAAGGMCHYTGGDAHAIMRYAYRFIYLFHMPAFFMVAGCLWKRKEGVPIGNVIKHRIDRLVIPYFIWGILSAAIFIGTESVARMLADGSSWYYGERMFGFPWWRPFVSILHAGDWPNGEGFRCNSVLWFLPCMFVVLSVYDGLGMLRSKMRRAESGPWFDIGLLAIFTVLGAEMRFHMPKYLPWGISRAPYMMIFFLVGRLLNSATFAGRLKVSGWACAIGWIAYGYLAWLYPDLGLAHYSWKWYMYAVMLATAGCLLSLYTAKAWQADFLVRLGLASMGIMLLHKFLMMPIQLCYGRLAGFGIIVAVSVVIASLAMVTLVSCWAAVAIRRFVPWMVGERR